MTGKEDPPPASPAGSSAEGTKVPTDGTGGTKAVAIIDPTLLTRVGVPNFDGTNYRTWAHKTRAALALVGLEDALHDADHPASRSIKSFVALTLGDNYLSVDEKTTTAKELWEYFKALNATENKSKLLTLKSQFNLLRRSPGETLTGYTARARGIAADIEAAGGKLDDTDLVIQILAGLGPEFDTAKIFLTLDDKRLTLDEIFPKLLVVESSILKKEFGNAPPPAKALFTPGVKPPPVRPGGAPKGSNGGARPPFSRGPTGNRPRPKPRVVTCFYCKAPGHVIKECRKRKEAEERKARGDNGNTHTATDRTSGDVVFCVGEPTGTHNEEWFFDSGASRHITPHINYLHDPRPCADALALGDGTVVTAAAVGTVELFVPGTTRRFFLLNVLCIPSFKCNLISTTAVRRAGYHLHSDLYSTTLTYKGLEIITATDHPVNGVPFIKATASVPAAHAPTALALTKAESAELAHARFGHLGYSNMARLTREGMVTGITVPSEAFARHTGVCEPCAIARLGKLPFRRSEPKTTRPLELVHTDVVGPVTPATHDGFSFFCTFLDDYTGFSIVKLLAYKRDVFEFITSTIELVENKTGFKVGGVRSDRGGEYISKHLAAYFGRKGITHERSMAYTPEQNGKAERHNRTLLTKASTLLNASKLSLNMWGEAVHTANYVRNLSPVEGKPLTPWEALIGRKPDVSHLRVFGSRAFVLIPEPKRLSKFSPRGEAGIMVGYPYYGSTTGKGYRVLTPNGKIVESRHVVFDEAVFPGHTHAPGTPDTHINFGYSAPNVVSFDYFFTPTGIGADNDGKEGTNTAGNGSPPPPGHESSPAGSAGSPPAHTPAPSPAHSPVRSFDLPSPASTLSTPGADIIYEPTPPPPPPAAHTYNLRPRHEGRVVAPPLPLAPAPPADSAAAGDSPEPAAPPRGIRALNIEVNPVYDTPGASALVTTADIIEPTTFKQAMASDQADQWRVAMEDEMESLYANDTWEAVPLPAGMTAIPTKWVYKIKRDGSGNVERFKARLVVKGFYQIPGVDYSEVFAPVTKYASFRSLMAIAATKDFEMRHLDIKTAFLNGDVEEEIYIEPPPGYNDAGPGYAYRLRKALYGLKQAPRAWHTKLDAELTGMGLTASRADPGLYTGEVNGTPVYLLVYVDDIIVASSTLDPVAITVKSILSAFDGRDLGEPSLFLGMKIERDRPARVITISQCRMITDLLSKYGMDDAKTRAIPLSPSTRLSKDEGEPLDTHIYPYSSLVGALLYITVCTRPDIAYPVGVLSRFMAKPTTAHWLAAKGVVRYLAGTINFGLTFKGSAGLTVLGYCDSDYAADRDTRRSTTGFIFTLAGGAITWSSKRQATVAASTTEAEYVAAASAVKEALWLRNLLSDLGVPHKTIDIHGDNQAALKLLRNPTSCVRSKHIDVAHHLARERVIRKEVSFSYIPTDEQVADALTKALPITKIDKCRALMGVC